MEDTPSTPASIHQEYLQQSIDPLEPTSSGQMDLQTARDACRNLNWLAAVALPEMVEYLFPPLFMYFWDRCSALAGDSVGHHRLGLGIPRGFAKTTFLKLLILYIILFTRRKYILVICASEDLAASIIADVVDALDHPNIRALFGNWDDNKESDRIDSKVFHFRGRPITFKAVGRDTAFRGISRKFSRPDVMIFDDAQTKICSQSVSQSADFQDWMSTTAMKAGHTRNCFYLYVGNMYPKLLIKEATDQHPAIYACQLRNLKDNPDWETIIVGAITADGKSIWEEHKSLAAILAEYKIDMRAGQLAGFLSETMNDDEAQDLGMFDPTQVPDYPYLPDTPVQGQFLMIDPSLGKKKSDAQVVGKFIVIDGNLILAELRTYQVAAPVLVTEVIDWCMADGIPAVFTEAYGYQETLAHWFNHTLDDLGITEIQIVPINRGARSKTSAILSMLKEVQGGSILLAPAVRSKIYSEVRSYDPLARAPVDDQLDVASYGPLCLATAPEAIRSYLWTTYEVTATVVDAGISHG